MENKKQLRVSAIKNGTVIDHIPAKELFTVIKILKLDKIEKPITFGTNLDSKKLGKKAITKISEIFFEDKDINKIALITEEAQLNIIKDYQVVEKKNVILPKKIVEIANCVNPKCITNHENIISKFTVVNNGELGLRCEYCEKITTKQHFKILR